MAIVCAGRDSNMGSCLLLFGEINRIHRRLLCDCFSGGPSPENPPHLTPHPVPRKVTMVRCLRPSTIVLVRLFRVNMSGLSFSRKRWNCTERFVTHGVSKLPFSTLKICEPRINVGRPREVNGVRRR